MGTFSIAASANIEIPSVLESNPNWINSLFENMSDAQIVAYCCAVLIALAILAFTFLTAWVIGREYAEKVKSFTIKYPKLNKIFLFYLKWAEITSVPARIFFSIFIYIELSLCMYYLTYIPYL